MSRQIGPVRSIVVPHRERATPSFVGAIVALATGTAIGFALLAVLGAIRGSL